MKILKTKIKHFKRIFITAILLAVINPSAIFSAEKGEGVFNKFAASGKAGLYSPFSVLGTGFKIGGEFLYHLPVKHPYNINVGLELAFGMTSDYETAGTNAVVGGYTVETGAMVFHSIVHFNYEFKFWDIKLAQKPLVPYLGLGLGMAMSTITQTAFGFENTEDQTAFLYEFVFGAAYKLNPIFIFTEMTFSFAESDTVSLGAAADTGGGFFWTVGAGYPLSF
ncbi:MAG: hypothetical protein OEZ22_12955 [Spirochaetia bacterium]|nr:hypothetical protein [Spirochaetia bacterium]